MTGWDDATLRQVGTLFGAGTVAGLTDAELVDRFNARRGGGDLAELAFAAIVSRHGPTVLATCRHHLRGDPHAAEDAFQATFLVLARRSASLRVGESLAPWLREVARRVASCARMSADRRRLLDRKAGRSEMVSDRDGDDLGSVVRDEVFRLPTRYRRPVELCDLEERSYEEAARRLGCPVGTIKSRLARGRGLLRSRLIRRGVAPAVAAMAGLAATKGRAAVPDILEQATIRAALRLAAAGRASAGVFPAASALALAEEALRSMVMLKWKAVGVSLALGLVAASGAVVFARQVPSGPPAVLPASDPFKSKDAAPVPIAASPALPSGLVPIAASPALPSAPVATNSLPYDPEAAPTDAEVWQKFLRERFSNVAFQVEFVGERFEGCKVYPQLGGPRKLVRRTYKATINFDFHEKGNSDHGSEVVTIEKNFLRPCDDPKHSHDDPLKASADPRSTLIDVLAHTNVVSRPTAVDPNTTLPSTQERRLAEVEKKLDLILKKLEGGATPDQLPGAVSSDLSKPRR